MLLFLSAFIAVGALVLVDRFRASPPPLAAQAQDGVTAFLPLALLGQLPAPTATGAASATPRPTASATATAAAPTDPPASPTPDVTPTPQLVDTTPLLQVATYGRAAPDTSFGVDLVRVSPWFTLYGEDVQGATGQVVTYLHAFGAPDLTQPRFLERGADDVAALMLRLADEVQFWDLEVPEPSGLCVPDLDTTAVYAKRPGAEAPGRAVQVYGLHLYLQGDAPCRPREGTPGPPDERLVSLARLVVDLRQPRPEAVPYRLEDALLVVTRDRPTGQAPAWPLRHNLLAIAPTLLQPRSTSLRTDEIAPALDAIGQARAAGWTMARFAQGDERFVIGVRPQPPQWWLTGAAEPGSSP